MKQRVCFTIFIIFLSLTISAQQASRFPIKPGSVWRINYEFCCGEDGFNHQNGDEEYKYYIDGDTVINSKNYFKLYKTGILFLDSPFPINHKYICAIRDTANKFYFVDEGENSEVLLYDFDAEVGEPLQPDGFPVDEIDTLENGRKRYYFFIITVHCGSANTIIEGIGWLGGLLEGNSCSGHPGVRGSYTVCYTEDDEVVYLTDHTRNGNPVTCNLEITPVKETKSENEMGIVVLPDKMLEFIFPEVTGETWNLSIYSVSGIQLVNKHILLSQPVSVENFNSGTYIARIQSQNQNYVVKFIIE